jgi:pimeloyl-ACP methyl ester carboxylesterase
MQTFSASDGVKLRYVVDDFSDPWKPKQTLFLLHAAMGSSKRMYAWVPHLARHFRVVRPDTRGHGQSEVPGVQQLSLDRLARDVVELADHLGCPGFHVAGSSAGAIVAMQVAIGYPGRVLTLGNFASTPGLKNSQINTDNWVAHIRRSTLEGFLRETISDRFAAGTDPGFMEWFITEAAKTDQELFCRFAPMMKQVDLTAELHKISCPMLVVVPDHDPLGTIEQYRVIPQQVKNCEFVVYSGLPHNITDAVPDRCAEELKRFLLKHTPAD